MSVGGYVEIFFQSYCCTLQKSAPTISYCNYCYFVIRVAPGGGGGGGNTP